MYRDADLIEFARSLIQPTSGLYPGNGVDRAEQQLRAAFRDGLRKHIESKLCAPHGPRRMCPLRVCESHDTTWTGMSDTNMNSPAFYDSDGVRHKHDGNPWHQLWVCNTCMQRFEIRVPHTCTQCEWVQEVQGSGYQGLKFDEPFGMHRNLAHKKSFHCIANEQAHELGHV